MLSGVYYPDGTKVEYRYDALRQKVERVQSFYDQSKIDNMAKNESKNQNEHANSNGKSSSNKGKQNAITRGNGEENDLYKQMEGSYDNLLNPETTLYLNDGLNVM